MGILICVRTHGSYLLLVAGTTFVRVSEWVDVSM
jgi:hypothetical protein